MKLYKYDGYEILESPHGKALYSENANYVFNVVDGQMITWGKTLKEDAEKFPAPTIADIEITTICNGNCSFCYKSNTTKGTYMTLNTFKQLFDKLPKSITQIAFGADYDLTSNPDIWDIMKYTRDNGVVPNVTAGKVTDEAAEKLVKLCGAVATSNYNKEVTYDSVKRLTDRGMKQVNIHQFLSDESLVNVWTLFKDYKTDERLSKLNAIVFLSLKQKGRGKSHQTASQKDFNKIVAYALENNIPIGFDSCSSLKFFRSLNEKQYNTYADLTMPCESTLESSYIDVTGEFYPCSFCENIGGWEQGIDVLNCKDFVKDVWNNERTEKFRNKLLDTKKENEYNCRNCPIYEI